MRTAIVPDLIRVDQSTDNRSEAEILIHDEWGHCFALRLDREACRALREAVTALERRLSLPEL